MSEWTDNALSQFVQRLTDWAEKDPSDFVIQSLLYLLPFMLVASCLTLKLNSMISTLRDEERQLEKMKKVTKKD